jgi:hypothetical protein
MKKKMNKIKIPNEPKIKHKTNNGSIKTMRKVLVGVYNALAGMRVLLKGGNE